MAVCIGMSAGYISIIISILVHICMQVEIPIHRYFLLYGINYKDTGTFPYMHRSVAIHTFKDTFLCTYVTWHEENQAHVCTQNSHIHITVCISFV